MIPVVCTQKIQLRPRSIAGLLSFALMGSLLTSCGENADNTEPLIGVTQIIEHKALDQERYGFLKAIEQSDMDDVRIVVDIAQGNIATATQIAQKFAHQNPKVIVTFSTPSAQSALSVAARADIPVVFSAVTDALSSRIVSTYDTPRPENVTGVVDYIPPIEYINYIKMVMPNARHIGIMYNAGEANSAHMVNELKDAFEKAGLSYTLAAVSKSSDVTQAAQSLVGKVDVIFVPNDNTVVAAISSVVAVAEKHKLPVLAADFGSFASGVMGVIGYDREMLGRACAEIVLEIMEKGTPASHIPIKTQHELLMFVNQDAAKRMGYALPAQGLDDVRVVDDTGIVI